MHLLKLSYFQSCFLSVYVSPKISTKDKLEKITDVICFEKGSKIKPAGDINLDLNTQEGEGFVKA